jgi:hypothetical protein
MWSKWLSRFQLALGATFVFFALLLNPRFVERFVTRDQNISSPKLLFLIVLVEVLLFAAGCWTLVVARRTRRSGKTFDPKAFLFAGSTLVVTTLLTAAAIEVGIRLFVDPLEVLQGEAWWEYRLRRQESNPLQRADDQSYGFDRFDPELGWIPKANFDFGGVRTNSMGIRATREYDFERSPGIRRIVIVGDSFSWGEDVSNEETYAAQLEGILPSTEVINLGVHGYGTDQQLIYLRKLGFRFSPDLVILGFYHDNLERNGLRIFVYGKPMFVLEGDRLVQTNTPVPRPEVLLAGEQDLPASRLLEFMKGRYTYLRDRTALSTPAEWPVSRKILSSAKRETEEHGARFMLLSIPFPSWQGERRHVEVLLNDWAESAGAQVLNLRESFARLPATEWDQLYRGHWTPFGNRRAAEAVRDFIDANGLLPPIDEETLPPSP